MAAGTPYAIRFYPQLLIAAILVPMQRLQKLFAGLQRGMPCAMRGLPAW
jgi:hypothetical protein